MCHAEVSLDRHGPCSPPWATNPSSTTPPAPPSVEKVALHIGEGSVSQCAHVYLCVWCVAQAGSEGWRWEGVSPAGRINKPIQLNVAPALPNVPALLQQCRRQLHPLLIRWSFASEAGSLVERERWRWRKRGGYWEEGRQGEDLLWKGNDSKRWLGSCSHPAAFITLSYHIFSLSVVLSRVSFLLIFTSSPLLFHFPSICPCFSFLLEMICKHQSYLVLPLSLLTVAWRQSHHHPHHPDHVFL